MFLVGDDLQQEIGRVLSGSKLRCAVAFWGTGAADRIPAAKLGKARLICNLQTGGTNPSEIKKLMKAGAAVRTHAKLHAKVYISNNGAVVTSANMSANGLGFEGKEQAYWEEAGVFLNETDEITDWFDRLWADDSTQEITSQTLTKAMAAWRARQRFKPTPSTFADVDIRNINHLIAWWGDEEHVDEPESIIDQVGRYDSGVARRILRGAQIDGDRDRSLLPGRWILWWTPNRDGTVRRRTLSWVRLGGPVENAFRYKNDESGKLYSVVIEAEEELPPPFPLDDRFERAFAECMKQPKYELLRCDDENEEGSWFTAERLALTKDFWKDLQQMYRDPPPPTANPTRRARRSR